MSSRQNSEINVPDFSGGQVSAKGTGTLAPNEMAAINNVILHPGGNGFRSREGNSALNSSAIGSGSAVTGLGYIKTLAGVESIVGVAGTTISSDVGITGTFADITGGLTITSGQNNLFTLFQADSKMIGVGGAPNAPFKYTGTGNAALLGGSPPAGRYGFQYGNRTFIMSTVANPSTIYWTVLLNSEDWSSTGSGSSDVQPNDGDMLITAAPINLNTVILFKSNSIYLMTGRDSPFPIFPLFKGIGCAGPRACVVYKGLAYFITSQGQMAITDGNQIVQLPHISDTDDVWRSLRRFRLPYVQGTVVNGPDFDWLIWSTTKSAANTNDFGVIWDLRHNCWAGTCANGFEANAYATTIDNVVYMGGYDGKVYKLFASNTYTDASNSSAAVSWSVESDWVTLQHLLSVKQVNRANILFQTRAAGTMTLSEGYDFTTSLTNNAFSIATTNGALWDTAQWDVATWDGYNAKIKNIFTFGRGNVFKWKLSGSSAVSYDVSSITLFGKNKSQRNFDAVA